MTATETNLGSVASDRFRREVGSKAARQGTKKLESQYSVGTYCCVT